MTDIDYTGWKNGKCWTIATKFFGPGADKTNTETVSKMIRDGYEVREMPLHDACEAHRQAIRSML